LVAEYRQGAHPKESDPYKPLSAIGYSNSAQRARSQLEISALLKQWYFIPDTAAYRNPQWLIRHSHPTKTKRLPIARQPLISVADQV
jgi:hypothetical protein